ncbi:hypothetical protein B0H63DRAFT_187158 [Podospora didyma]|uniref:Clr5 domain-containing protein n=1 Tax=Podospora didyma TaxID=330526 RepID=A0AAE0NQP3_9PEZI|nr:hypothetical protein B0H63DRAFT_187158 [Podospora didyma]
MEHADPGQSHQAAGWVAGDEWDLHRSVIQELYQGQNMPLKDVMKIMEDRHGFRATQRMYKTRIKSWGLDKNFKESEVVELYRLRRERDRAGKPVAVYTIRGREVDWERVQSYVRRKGLDIPRLMDTAPSLSPSAAREITCRTPTPTPRTTRPPAPDLLEPLASPTFSSASATTWSSSSTLDYAPTPTLSSSFFPYHYGRRGSSYSDTTTAPPFPPSPYQPLPTPQSPETLAIFQKFLTSIYNDVMFEDGDRAWGTTEYWLRNARSQEWIMTMRYKLGMYRGFMESESARGNPDMRRFQLLNRSFATLEPTSPGDIGSRMFYLINFFYAFANKDPNRNPFTATAMKLVDAVRGASATPPMRISVEDDENIITTPDVVMADGEDDPYFPAYSNSSSRRNSAIKITGNRQNLGKCPATQRPQLILDSQLDFRESAERFLGAVLDHMVQLLGLTLPKGALLLLEEDKDGYPILDSLLQSPTPAAPASTPSSAHLSPLGHLATTALTESAASTLDSAVHLLSRHEDTKAEELLELTINSAAGGKEKLLSPGSSSPIHIAGGGATSPSASSSSSSKKARALTRCANYHVSRMWRRRGDHGRANTHMRLAVEGSLLYDAFVSWDEVEFLFA